MSSKILITRPNYDPVTAYLYYWASEVIDTAKGYSHVVMELSGLKVNEKEFVGHIQKAKPKLVLLNGHGSETMITGHNREPLVTIDTAELLEDKITYALSCSAAKQLGPIAVKQGARAFIGYENDFTFTTARNREGNPAKDKRAEPFKNAVNIVSISLIEGNTVDGAYQRSQQRFHEEIRKLASSAAKNENKDVRFWLFWDMDCQKYDGDGTARI
jgi:hypothetical protein